MRGWNILSHFTKIMPIERVVKVLGPLKIKIVTRRQHKSVRKYRRKLRRKLKQLQREIENLRMYEAEILDKLRVLSP